MLWLARLTTKKVTNWIVLERFLVVLQILNLATLICKPAAFWEAARHARAIVYQRKKKEENRSIFQETLKRDFIKEKNYLIFQLREGEDRCSYDVIGEVLDNLGLAAQRVM